MIFTRTKRRAASKPRGQPEHKLQVQVRQFLLYCLPPEYEWTANAAGSYLSARTAEKNKAAGVRKGWPDLQILFPNGRTHYIELKTATGTLSAEQREFAVRCHPHKIFAVCRSVDEVEARLREWDVPLRAHPFRNNTNTEIASAGLG